MAPTSPCLDPRVLAALGDLQLVARAVADGFLSGLHAAARPGTGSEFRSYRCYQPGDELRRVDWRLYARSDRYFVRESMVEREVTVRFLLDASASMAHEEDGVSKLDYGRWLVATLAYLAVGQGDHLAAAAVRAGQLVMLGDGRLRQPLDGLFLALERLTPAGGWPPATALPLLLGGRRDRHLIVVVSDLYDPGGELRSLLSWLRGGNHEVMVFHLIGRRELTFAHDGDVLFEDLETGAAVRTDAGAIREAYLERLQRELAAWRRKLLDLAIWYEQVATDVPLDRALRAFLLRRMTA